LTPASRRESYRNATAAPDDDDVSDIQTVLLLTADGRRSTSKQPTNMTLLSEL